MTLYISRKFRHVPRCHDDLCDLSYDNSKLQLLYTVVQFSMKNLSTKLKKNLYITFINKVKVSI